MAAVYKKLIAITCRRIPQANILDFGSISRVYIFVDRGLYISTNVWYKISFSVNLSSANAHHRCSELSMYSTTCTKQSRFKWHYAFLIMLTHLILCLVLEGRTSLNKLSIGKHANTVFCKILQFYTPRDNILEFFFDKNCLDNKKTLNLVWWC